MVPELVEAALTDPLLALSEAAANWQIARLPPAAASGEAPGFRRPPPAQPPSRLRLLINSLEAALLAAVGEALLSAAQGFLPKHLRQYHLETLVNSLSSAPSYSGVTHMLFPPWR